MNTPRLRRSVVLSFLIVAALARAAGAAVPIEQIGTFHFRSAVTPNTLGVRAGDVLTFGGDFRQNQRTGDPGTNVTASQGGVVLNVPYLDSPALPDEFATAVDYDPADPAGPRIEWSHQPGRSAAAPRCSGAADRGARDAERVTVPRTDQQ